jgi:predicted ABC-type ATPase
VFEQAAAAHRNGFQVTMRYLGIEDVEINLRRIRVRHRLGFHAAPEDVLRSIHARSFENLRFACRNAFLGQMHLILYDNTAFGIAPVRAFVIRKAETRALVTPLPAWVRSVIDKADFS